LVAHIGLEHEVDFITASLSKTFCARGGIVTCSSKFKNYFTHHSFPAIFSSVVQNHEAVRFLKTLEVIIKEDWRREKLQYNTEYLHKHLDYIGFNTEVSTSPIIALEVNNESKAILLRDFLVSKHVVTAPFIPPAVPKRRCNSRMTVNCQLTQVELDRIVAACKDALPIVKLEKSQMDDFRAAHIKV
jgi:CAI-1 autoinducer synthase